MKLTKEQVIGIVRHVFTFAGGFVLAKGWVDETTLLEISGAVVTLVGAVWSVMDKKKAAPAEV